MLKFVIIAVVLIFIVIPLLGLVLEFAFITAWFSTVVNHGTTVNSRYEKALWRRFACMRVLDGEVLYLLADCFAMVDYDGLGSVDRFGSDHVPARFLMRFLLGVSRW